MSKAVAAAPPKQGIVPRSLFTWLFGAGSFLLLAFLILQYLLQVFVATPPAHKLVIVQDIPVPSALPNEFVVNAVNVPQKEDPLAPGVAMRFDHFDFQTLDPNTKLLFIAHTGPSPVKEQEANPKFNPDKNAAVDGNVLVFDTRQQKLVARLPLPQVAGIVAAPDLGKVYAADANDNVIDIIDERTFKTTTINVGDNSGNDSPDAVTYDQQNHRIFISDPGADLDHQGIIVIDTLTNKVTKINLGRLPKLPGERADLVQFGYDVGHPKYDAVLGRLFVATQQLTNPNAPTRILPPPGVAEFVEIDPATRRVVRRLAMPNTCVTPHGMSLDERTHIAYIACVDAGDNGIVPNLARVDLRKMQVIPGPLMSLGSKPDIVIIDHAANVVFVGCSASVAVFNIQGGTLSRLGPPVGYILGKNTHTVAVDEETQRIYLPLADLGGRPVLRIVQYNPSGV